ncbi:MAG: hypothetical protein OXI97_06545 [Acidimicrobiaceae bacterium]|nr:hypothetical protein [Acidimicrobiaceae bacterium]
MAALLAQISYREGIEEAWDDFVGFAPRLIAALVVLLVGWIVASLLRRLLVKGLTAVRFETIIERAKLSEPLSRVGVRRPSRLMATLIYWAAMLLVLQLAIDAFGESAIQNALDDLIGFLPDLFIAIAIIVIVGAIAARVSSLVAELLADHSYGTHASRVAGSAIWVVGIFAALDQIRIADDTLNVLFVAVVATVGGSIVVMFGIGGIQAARDRFWPTVFDRVTNPPAAEPIDSDDNAG